MSQERDEELLAAKAEIKILRDKAEHQHWQRYNLAKELDKTSQELEFISELLLKASVLVGLEQAKAVIEAICTDQQRSQQLVAKLLTAIHNLSFEEQDLTAQDGFKIERSKLSKIQMYTAIFKSQKKRKDCKVLRRANSLRRKAQ